MEEGGTSVHKTITEINLVFKGLRRHTVRTDKIGDRVSLPIHCIDDDFSKLSHVRSL